MGKHAAAVGAGGDKLQRTGLEVAASMGINGRIGGMPDSVNRIASLYASRPDLPLARG
jgi:hypothetical protein